MSACVSEVFLLKGWSKIKIHCRCHLTVTPVPKKVGCPYVRCKACLVPLCLNPFTARVLDGDFKVPLNSESVDEIQRCNHSYETSLPVLLHGAINVFNKMKFGYLVEIYF